MKILVVHASAGAGHQKAAEAIYHHLINSKQKVEAKLIDILDGSSSLFRYVYTRGYAFSVKYMPWFWGACYWLTCTRIFGRVSKWLDLIIGKAFTGKFIKTIIEENPDYIISCHFLPPEIAAYLKAKKKIKSRLVTVITDFGIHPYWITKGTDFYVVHSDFAAGQLMREGIRKEEIREFGIPVDEKFLTGYSRKSLCDKFGIDNDKFTILIVTGSFGIGPIEEMIDLLYQEVQILVVSANNKKLYDRLITRNYPQVKVFGFVDNIQELMAVSDLIFTKAGGLTIAECLAVGLPPVFIAAIPGQESQNIRVLSSCGIGIDARNFNPAQIKNMVLDFKKHPERLTGIKEAIKKLKKPNAARELCDAVC